MPMPKKELMAKTRQGKREAGLVRLDLWLLPRHAEAVRALVADLEAHEAAMQRKRAPVLPGEGGHDM
jgi:hypothetical protein